MENIQYLSANSEAIMTSGQSVSPNLNSILCDQNFTSTIPMQHPHYQLYSNATYLPHSNRVALTPVYSSQFISSRTSNAGQVSLPTHIVNIPTRDMEQNSDESISPPDTPGNNNHAIMEELCFQMTNRRDYSTNRLDEIKQSSPIDTEALNPEEVLNFYQTLPEGKKVTKSQRNKYRKYSFRSEYKVYKKSHDQS